MPVIPVGWTDRPCKTSLDCQHNILKCFKLSKKQQHGICVQNRCNSDLDCPHWMTCLEGTCIYQKCSSQRPCKPGLICAKGFCFLSQCSHNFHCPPNHECIGGRCTLSLPMCIDNRDCDVNSICDGIRCVKRTCYNEGMLPMSSLLWKM